MGPINLALVTLFTTDSVLRDAKARLDAATRGVRVQTKRAELAIQTLSDTAQKLKQAKAKQMALDSDLKARDAHIENLREQQQVAQNAKQFQALLVDINNRKLDREKIEEQGLAAVAEVDRLSTLLAGQKTTAEAEAARARQLQAEVGGKTSELQAEIDQLQPERDRAAADVPQRALELFDRLADNYDGEALAAVGHIDGRTEGYYCSSCNMELVVDVYNRLVTRDEILTCPGCGRILYIPEDLTPDRAVRQKKVVKPRATRAKTAKAPKKPKKADELTTARADGSAGLAPEVKRVVSTAAAESLRQASLEASVSEEVELFVAGKSAGTYTVRNAGHFLGLVRAKFQAEDMELQVDAKSLALADAAAVPQG